MEEGLDFLERRTAAIILNGRPQWDSGVEEDRQHFKACVLSKMRDKK